jgi:hypothetical protein
MKQQLNEVQRLQKIAGIKTRITEAVSAQTIENLIGMRAEETDAPEIDSDEYKTAQSFKITPAGEFEPEYLFDDFYLNIYDDNSFVFYYDASPQDTILHTPEEATQQGRTMMEIPKPLSQLNKDVADKVVADIIDNYGD